MPRSVKTGDVPVASIPLTAASATVRSTFFSTSLLASTALFWARNEVEKRALVEGVVVRKAVARRALLVERRRKAIVGVVRILLGWIGVSLVGLIEALFVCSTMGGMVN